MSSILILIISFATSLFAFYVVSYPFYYCTIGILVLP
jgi:hypothetical protein